MNPPRPDARRRLVLGIAGLGLGPLWRGARAADAGLEALFHSLAALGERRAGFVERRHSALLRQPTESRGTLHFKPPDILERRVTTPHAETVRIEGGTVALRTVGPDGRPFERKLQLALAPQLGWLAQTLRALLGGQLAQLRQLYLIDWKTGTQGWQMQLAPRDDQLAALVSQIDVTGTGERIERIETKEASGDRVELTLTPIR